MKDSQIYKKILVFVLPRIPCYIMAFLVFFLICVLFGLPAYYAGGSDVVYGIIVFVAAIAAVFVASFMKLPYQAAAISLIVKACNGTIISDHPYKEGMKDVKKRFSIYSPFALLVSTVKYIFDKDKTVEDKDKIINDAQSYFIFTFTNTFFYFKTCLLTEMMYFKNKPYSRCIFETLQTIKKNFKTFIIKTLKIFFFYLVIPIGIFIIVFMIISTVLQGNVKADDFASLVIESLELDMDKDSLYFYILGLIFTFIAYIFTTPFATIKVVRFFNDLINKTEFDYSKYDKFDKRTDKMKVLRRIKEAESRKMNNENE